MAARPITATRVSGLVEVVEDGETGLLVPSGDPAALAQAILELSTDPARRRALGEAGASRVARRFGVEEMVEATEAVYRRALGRRRAPGQERVPHQCWVPGTGPAPWGRRTG